MMLFDLLNIKSLCRNKLRATTTDICSYLSVSKDIVLKTLASDSQVRVNSFPVPVKLLVGDSLLLVEKYRDLDCRLVVWLRVIIQLWMSEIVIFRQRFHQIIWHFDSEISWPFNGNFPE